MTPGQAHDTQGFGPLMLMVTDRITALLADKGDDADAVRDELGCGGGDSCQGEPPRADPARPFQVPQVQPDRAALQKTEELTAHRDPLRQNADSYLGFVRLASVRLWIPFVHGS